VSFRSSLYSVLPTQGIHHATLRRLGSLEKSACLSAEIYKALAELKDYGFRDQITRSRLSIPSNIAEGMDRPSVKEKARFLDIVKGSAAELRTQIYIGIDIGYVPQETGKQWIAETKEISAMLVGLIRSLQTAH
jgi:four helix bundle protein